MPKPSPGDHHGHAIVKLPTGGEIVPEHFHEGPAAAQRFSKTVRDVLAVPHVVVAEKHQGMKQRAARAKQRRKAG